MDTIVGIMPKLPAEIKDSLIFNYITPYFISPHQSKTLYHGGNFVFKSIDRGNTWKVISPNLSLSSIREKKSFALGALAESKMEKGLLYAGTDKGACWVSKNDGINWDEISSGLSNSYIRSICPSRFVKERVYIAMTGINHDDLHHYLYVSEDYGKNWNSIADGLPDEPVNVILEDPSNENILYAGGLRGVYISTNRGKDWNYLGNQMPAASVADLEIHEPTMDLIAATHGRGIYKINLLPIQQMVKDNLSLDKDWLFKIPVAKRPWFNSFGGEPDYRTMEKLPIAFWLNKPKSILLSLRDSANLEIWEKTIEGSGGINTFRWDLVTRKSNSDYPYFIHYETFLRPGTYTLRLSVENTSLEQPVMVVSQESPYKK
jgi:hypothetical protein